MYNHKKNGMISACPSHTVLHGKGYIELTIVNGVAFKVNELVRLSVLRTVVAKDGLELGDLSQSEEPHAPVLELGITRAEDVPNAHTHAHTHKHTYKHVYTHIESCIHTYKHTYTQTHIYVHTHIKSHHQEYSENKLFWQKTASPCQQKVSLTNALIKFSTSPFGIFPTINASRIAQQEQGMVLLYSYPHLRMMVGLSRKVEIFNLAISLSLPSLMSTTSVVSLEVGMTCCTYCTKMERGKACE